MVYFWVVMLHRVYYESKQKSTQLFSAKIFYLLGVAYLGMFLGVFLFYANIDFLPEVDDRSMFELRSLAPVVVLAVFLLGFVIHQLVMLILIVIKGCKEEKPYLWRHVNYLVTYPLFVVMYLVFLFIGGPRLFYYNRFIALYGYCFLNLYVCLLQFMFYTPWDRLVLEEEGPADFKNVNVEMGSYAGGTTNEIGSRIEGESVA